MNQQAYSCIAFVKFKVNASTFFLVEVTYFLIFKCSKSQIIKISPLFVHNLSDNKSIFSEIGTKVDKMSCLQS